MEGLFETRSCPCSFNGLMTATLEWQGIEAHIIGIARGISAATGIAATVAYPALQARISTTRTGLWSIWSQERVSESEPCVVGGVQNSLQSALELLGYVMGIIISDPKDFWKLNLMSVGVVTAAAFLYTGYVYKLRNHPFPFEKLLFELNSISVS